METLRSLFASLGPEPCPAARQARGVPLSLRDPLIAQQAPWLMPSGCEVRDLVICSHEAFRGMGWPRIWS
jgi:hypothetical protein